MKYISFSRLGLISTLMLTAPALTGAYAEGCDSPPMVPPDSGAYAGYSPWVLHSLNGVWEIKPDVSLTVDGELVDGRQWWLVYEDYNNGELTCTITETVYGSMAQSGEDLSSCESCSATYMVHVIPDQTDCSDETLFQVMGPKGWREREEIWGTSAFSEESIPSYWQGMDDIAALEPQYTVWIYDTDSAKRAFFPFYALSPTEDLIEIP